MLLDTGKLRKKTIENRLKWFYRGGRRGFQRRRKGELQTAANHLGLLSSLVVAAISIGFSAAGTWRVLDLQSYNLLHQAQRELAGSPSWSDQLVVIAIDDASVDQLGYLPWPRQYYADLLNQLSNAQPAAVAFDILLSGTTSQDEPFAQSIVGSANVVLAVGSSRQGHYLDVSPTIANAAEGFFLKGDAGTLVDEDGVSRQMRLHGKHGVPSLGLATLQVYAENLAGTTSATPLPARYPDPSGSVFSASAGSVSVGSVAAGSVAAASSAFQINSGATSFVNSSGHRSVDPIFSETLLQDLLPDAMPVWIKWPGEVSPSLSLSAFPSASFSSASSAVSSLSSAAQSSSLQLSPDWQPGMLQTYSYADVVNGQVDAGLFQNKIVLVGPTLTGVDTLRTPFQTSEPTNGVYFYAAMINNLLDQSFLRRPTDWQSLLLLGVLAMAGPHLLQKQGVWRRMAVVIGFPLLWMGLAYAGFVMGWWLPVAAPVVTIVLSALAVQLQEQREKQQLMALFSMNVSPGTAELIWRHKGQVLDRGELAAQDLTATVLFMDIRGFTSIAEALPSQLLLPWLNQYFETMTDCIMEHDGMVDKYIGDAIMAVFGAPVPRTHPDEIRADAIAALQAAVEMHGRLKRLNHQLAVQNLPEITFGIGIHTGALVGGTVGNRHRLNYSLFGDTVNVAARLESMTKSLPASAPFSVLLSASTYQLTKDSFPLGPFQSARLRGRQGQTEVYAIASSLKADAVSARADTSAMPMVSPMIPCEASSHFKGLAS